MLLAESASELQDALNALHAYCNLWNLKVNLDKTKVVVFSRGKTRRYKHFKYGNDVIEVVDDYVYLGIVFNYNNKFNKARTRLRTLALKSTFGLITKIKQNSLPMDVAKQLVETCVIPVLLYGCEVWGHESVKDIQVCLNNILRYVLGLNKTTPTCMLYGEFGFQSVDELVTNRILNFWFNLTKSSDNKLSKILYTFSKSLYDTGVYRCPWLTHIQNKLDFLGISYVFNVNDDLLLAKFKNMIKTRINDIYNQMWQTEVYENQSCVNYRLFADKKEMKKYLTILPRSLWSIMIKFRCVNIKIPVVIGRYNQVPLEERICHLCPRNSVGDQFHYLFECSYFSEIRNQLIKRYYRLRPNVIKMSQLMQTSNKTELLNLAKLIKAICVQFR